MLVVAMAVLAAGTLLALSLKPVYVAQGAVLLSSGGTQSAAVERELLGSPLLAARTLERLGLRRAYPDLATQPEGVREASQRLVSDLRVEADETVLRVSFQHENPDRARQILDALLAEYLDYRRAGLETGDAVEEIQRLNARVAAADEAYADFLRANQTTDTDRAALDALLGEIEGQRRLTDARVMEYAARLAVLDRALPTEDPWRVKAAADLAGARRAQSSLARQFEELQARQRRLIELEPKLRDLGSARDVLHAVAADVAQAYGRRRALTGAGLEGPRILQTALEARPAFDYRAAILALTILLALGAALWTACLRLSLRRGLPAAKTAARTLGMPLMGAAKGEAYADLGPEMADLWRALGVGVSGPSRIIQVTSTREGEGASEVARELALYVARKLGRSVWLVDLDLALSGQCGAIASDPRRYGALAGPAQASPDGSAFFEVSPQAYRPSGEPVRNGAYLAAYRVGAARWWVTRFLRERLLGPQVAAIAPTADYWSALRRYVEVVIVHGPAAEGSAAALAVAPFMDQVILVVAADEPDIAAPARYRDAMLARGGPPPGLFLNRAP